MIRPRLPSARPPLSLPLLLAQALTCALAACSPAIASAPTALLAPDSVLVVRLESLRAWDELDQALGRDADGPTLLRTTLDGLTRPAPGAAPRAELDEGRPLYFGLSLDPAQRPAWTLLTPVTNGRALHLEGTRETRVHRGYAAATSRPSLPLASRPTALADELAPGLCAARVDLARLVAAYRPLIDTGLRQLGAELDRERIQAPVARAVLELYLEEAPRVLDAARSLDLALAREGEELVARLGFVESTAPVPSGPRAELEPLAARLDPSARFQLVFNGTVAQLHGQTASLFAGLEALLTVVFPERGPLHTLGTLASLTEPGLALALAPGPDGLHAAALVRSGQPAELVDGLAQRLEAPADVPGPVQLGAERRLAHAGLELRLWPLELDGAGLAHVVAAALELPGDSGDGLASELAQRFEQLEGEHLFALGHSGGLVLVALAPDEEHLRADLGRLRDGSAPTPGWTRLLGRCEPGSLALVGRLDLRWPTGPAPAPDAEPAPLELGFWVSARGSEGELGACTRLAQLRAVLASPR
ncbi:MAG TPA: hypothetical protein VF530_12975 [Planctomycetota bacterium]